MRSSPSPARYPSDLTDEQWALIEPIVAVSGGGRPAIHPRRRFVEAIDPVREPDGLFVAAAGARLPAVGHRVLVF